MYQKYQTEALVLRSRESGEMDRVIELFTKDFGLVWARATAIRHERSRMRYALQHYARADVALVRGKRGWRLAGAVAFSPSPRGEALGTYARIASLVARLVHGEEENRYLFATLVEAHDALAREKASVFGTIELVCVARVLYSLGYISSEALGTALFTHTAYTGESLLEAKTMKDRLLASVNQAIAETHL